MIRRLVAESESIRFSTRRLTKNQLSSARPIISASAQTSARPMISRNCSRSPMSRPTSMRKPLGQPEHLHHGDIAAAARRRMRS